MAGGPQGLPLAAPSGASDASSVVSGAQAQLLAAMAQSGTAGANAFNQAQQSIQASRAGALQDAQARAGLINMGSTNAAITGLINAPIDRRLNDIAQARSSFAADQAARATGARNYFGELGATLPLLSHYAQVAGENQGRNIAARIQAVQDKQGVGSDAQVRTKLFGEAQLNQDRVLTAAAQQAQQQKAAADNAQLAMSRGEQAQGAPTKQGGDVSGWYQIANEARQSGDTQKYATALYNIGRVASSLQKQQGNLDTAQQGLTATNQAAAPFQRPLFEQAREIGVKQGLDPARVYGLVGPQQEAALVGAKQRLAKYNLPVDDQQIVRKAGVAPQELAGIRDTGFYKTVAQLAADGKLGQTWEEVSRNIKTSKAASKYPRAVKVLLAEQQGLYPSEAQLLTESKYAQDPIASGILGSGG